MLIFKASLVWALILVCAVLNGAFREGFLLPRYGLVSAFVLSGLLLSVCIVLVSLVAVPWFGRPGGSRYLLLGLFWVSLTLVFEFSFGRLAQHRSWSQLLEPYTFKDGNLWPAVLIVTALSPWLAAHLRGLDRRAAPK